jgi:multiple sugar transport system substrate-binding protein
MDRRQFVQYGSAVSALGLSSAYAQSKGMTYVGWSQDEAASKPTLTALFDGFRSSQPGARLDVIGFPFGQMQQNVLLRLRSGQPLDVVQLTERWLPQFATTGRMIDMNQVFGRGVLEKQINPDILKFGEFRGKQLGVPWTAGSIGMVANAKVMQDAGLSTPPLTIDEFLTALRAIKRTQPQSVPYALMTKNNNSLSPEFQTWLWTFGGSLFNDKGQAAVNSAAGVRALGFMTDLVREGLAAKDIDRPDARRMFAQHQTGFYNDAPLARGFARNNSGKGNAFDAFVVAMPTPVVRKGDTPRAFAWSHLLCMFGDGKSVPNAQSTQAKFISHLALSAGSQLQYFKEQGLFPVVGSAINQLASDLYVSTWTKAARSALRDEISFWPNSADLTTIVGEEVQAALLGQKTAQAAVENMGKRLDAKLAELPKN